MKRYQLIVLMTIVFLLTPSVSAQVTLDVAKITCEQHLTFGVADPKDIALWLNG